MEVGEHLVAQAVEAQAAGVGDREGDALTPNDVVQQLAPERFRLRTRLG